MKKTDYQSVINHIGQYVHDHIDGPLTLELLAEQVSLSKYHLNRVFQVVTGYQIGEFITRRRMERAYAQLSMSSASVLEVGLSVGYQSHSAFSRAFRRAFGISPSEASKEPIRQHQIPNTVKRRVKKTPLIPQVQNRLPETLVGLYGKGFREHTYLETAQLLYGQVHQVITKNDLGDPAKMRHVGVSLGNPWLDEQDTAPFFAGVAIPGSMPLELDCFIWQQGPWAKVTHRGSYRQIWQTISQFYASWIIPRGIGLQDAIVQEYLNNPATTQEAELETNLYFGLQPEVSH